MALPEFLQVFRAVRRANDPELAAYCGCVAHGLSAVTEFRQKRKRIRSIVHAAFPGVRRYRVLDRDH